MKEKMYFHSVFEMRDYLRGKTIQIEPIEVVEEAPKPKKKKKKEKEDGKVQTK